MEIKTKVQRWCMCNIKKQYINKSLKKLHYKHSKKKNADVAQ